LTSCVSLFQLNPQVLYAFTEQGVAMLSSVLRSKHAVRVNVEIVRTFVRLRRMLAENAGLAQRLDELEKKYDIQFRVVFDAIRQLMRLPGPKGKHIGFTTDDGRSGQTGPSADFTAHDRPAAELTARPSALRCQPLQTTTCRLRLHPPLTSNRQSLIETSSESSPERSPESSSGRSS
jgi:hypothetical protein